MLHHLFKCHSWSYQKKLASKTCYVPGTVLGSLDYVMWPIVILKYCLHFPDEAAQLQGRKCPCPGGLLSISYQRSGFQQGLPAPKLMFFLPAIQ